MDVLAGALAAMGVGFIIADIVIFILIILSYWMIFDKAGQPGWAAIIPIYNIIVLLQVIKKPIWWIILMLIPFVNIIVAIIVIHGLSKAFGKGGGFTVGLILLPFIFFPVLAFGDATYQLGGADNGGGTTTA